MTFERRPQLAQRRRRVLYTHHSEDAERLASVRRAQALREARRPAKAYGSRVYRRLRARWFGLVPVRRRTMMLVASIVTAVLTVLTILHAAALAWAPLAYQPAIARPFRLDRPDSFGNWIGTLLLASGAIVALMIYQLRRHRTDDYQGHYRLWRPAMILLALASVETSMQLTEWLGHVVDHLMGGRRAIAGGDWMRLLLVIGGTAFGMRLIAEVRRSKLAVGCLAAAACLWLFPAFVRWNFVQLNSLAGTTMFAAASFWGSGFLWVGLVAYLRMLYRDVRKLDAGDRLSDHLQHYRQRLREVAEKRPRWTRRPAGNEDEVASPAIAGRTSGRRRSQRAAKQDPEPVAELEETIVDAGEAAASSDEEPTRSANPPKRKRRWWPLGRKTGKEAAARSDEDAPTRDADAEATEPDEQNPPASPKERPARRFLRFRRPRKPSNEAPADTDRNASTDDGEEAENATPSSTAKRRWLGRLRRSSSSQGESPASESEAPVEADVPVEDRTDEADPVKKKRRWLPNWSIRLRPATIGDEGSDEANADGTAPDEDAVASSKRARHAPQTTPPDDDAEDDFEEIDPDAIDWDGLSKSERRRLKRQLKRQNRAA